MNSSIKVNKKVLFVGYYGVGKTSLIRRYVEGIFSETYQSSIGVNIKKKEVILPAHTVLMLIWDTEGGRKIEELPKSYFMGSSGIVYVIDLSREETWADLVSHIEYIKTLSPNAAVSVIANKSDLVEEEDMFEIIASLPIDVELTTSAKSGDNVEALFTGMANKMI